jgi:hypothetical protein
MPSVFGLGRMDVLGCRARTPRLTTMYTVSGARKSRNITCSPRPVPVMTARRPSLFPLPFLSLFIVLLDALQSLRLVIEDAPQTEVHDLIDDDLEIGNLAGA